MEKTKVLSDKKKRLTRAQAIRAKCLDCCCDDRKEVTACNIKNCPLWVYRKGYEVDINGNKVSSKQQDVF